MPLPLPLLPTSLVGSYPQPEWLIDRKKLAGRFPPRVRRRNCGGSRPNGWSRRRTMQRCSPSAIRSAPASTSSPTARCAARATPTASPPRSTASTSTIRHRARPLRPSQPGAARSSARSRRRHPVEVRDVEFLRANTDRTIKMTVPGPFTMSQQAQNDFYKDEEEMALDYAEAVNDEINDLFAAGADIVQIDEPYMQARPEKARQYGLTALNAALNGVNGRRPCTSASATRPSSTGARRAIRSCPSLRFAGAAGLDRDRAVEARLLGAGEAAAEDDHPRRARSLRHDGRDARDRGGAHPPRARLRAARANRHRARLRHEVSAARGRLRQDEGDGRRREDRARGIGRRNSDRVQQDGAARRHEAAADGSPGARRPR